MTGADFTVWLHDMQAAGVAPRQLDAARLLGVSVQSVATFKRDGCDHRTALACAALLAQIPAYVAPGASSMRQQ